MKQKIQAFFFLFVLCELFLCYSFPAYAQVTVTPYGCTADANACNTGSGPEATIKKYLCAPTVGGSSLTAGPGATAGQFSPSATAQLGVTSGANNAAQGDLYNCINRLYRFAIILTATAGTLMIVIGGYRIIAADGNEEAVKNGKDMLVSSIAAMVILMIGYLFLRTLNPDLIKFQPIQPPSVALNAASTPTTDIPSFDGGTDKNPKADIPSGSAKDLAIQILASTKIALATQHTSSNNDNASARQNIVDTSQGKAASRSSYTDSGQTGPGGTVGISDNVLKAIIALTNPPYSYSISISEIAGGVHSANSDHYTGRAFDINTINGANISITNPDFKALMTACTALGATQVIGPPSSGHATHVHCGWGSG